MALDRIDEAVTFIKSQISDGCDLPKVGIVCGSGLSNMANLITQPISILYEHIPNFPRPTVLGHGSRMVLGQLHGVRVMCLLGRFHYYEGHEMETTVFPIRVMSRLGIKHVLLTNAAGAIDRDLRVGDVMVIEDHISFLTLAGCNPLRGENLSQLGPRFPALTYAYHQQSHRLIEKAAELSGFPKESIKRGIYVNVGGPCYETPAEIRMMRMFGGGAVGMSTVPEVIAANHAGMNVIAFSLITNIGIGLADEISVEGPTHEEVLTASKARAVDLERLAFELIKLMSETL